MENDNGVVVLSSEDIARVCHDANRAVCIVLGDLSQVTWPDAPAWQKTSAVNGVTKILSGEITTPEQAHESWCREKVDAGWVYGDVKNPDAKTHPCLVSYDELPAGQRFKDAVFFAIVQALAASRG